MSKRFELSCCLFNEQDMDFIRDTKTNEEYVTLDELVPILNQQAERIAELEEQLKNTPKYPVYSKVFFIDDCEKILKEDFVEQITINHRDGIYYELVNNLLFEECELFATKEEAQAKLEELRGE